MANNSTNFQLSVTAQSLIRSGLFGKDFETYRSEIIDFLNARFGSSVATTIVASRQGIMLIEMVAFALSTASWYGDRQADDTTLLYCRLLNAAVAIARQLGYKAYASVPAAATITMTITAPSPLPAPLIIPQGTELTGPNGSNWELANQVTFNVGGPTTQTITAIEGTSLQETFISDGSASQIFSLTTVPTGMAIAQSSGMCTVASITWQESDILTYNQTNQFEVGYGYNPPRLIFGDGLAGNIPPANAQIVFQYFATHGTSGAAPAASVVSFVNPLISGTAIVTATLTQPAASTSGSAPESISQIKATAPLVFAAAKRAVSIQDLDGWINSYVDPVYGAVAIGRGTSPRSVNADAQALTIIAEVNSLGQQLVALQPSAYGAAQTVVTRLTNYWNKVLSSNCKANSIVVQILSADSIGRYVQASAGLAQSLETFLDSITITTSGVTVTDGSVNLLSINLTVGINLLPSYTNPASQATIISTVSSQLQAALVGNTYGISLRIADLYGIIQNVSGISYSNIAIQVLDNTGLDVTSSYANTAGDIVLNNYEVFTIGALPNINILQ